MPNTDILVTVRDVDSLRRRIKAWRADGRTVALVPTMGALHKGHLLLMDRALKLADRVIATIFVNPTQFAPTEDLAAYPRREVADFELLNTCGVHLLFAPDTAVMYPPGFSTTVHVGGLSDILCGKARPGHFDGVATVVTKLFLQTLPDIAVFGEKDYQQLCVIRRLAQDLNIPVDVVGVETVRESDGLAMSSRNAYLTADQRARAPALHAAISAAAASIAGGADVAGALQKAKADILASGFAAVDYVEARQTDTLAPLTDQVQAGRTQTGRVLAAAMLGRARLIDNVAIGTS
jgi:pantoate--beta-alanine ligase